MNEDVSQNDKSFRKKIPMQTANVVKVSEDNERIKTFELGCSLEDAQPGQFIMVWFPQIGERPLSIANNDPLTITVANVGKVSAEMHKLKKGDLVSFRGPLGNGFIEPEGKNGRILIIGGGYGVAPMYFLAKKARQTEIAVDTVIGARTSKDIIYEKRLYALSSELFITTDDGSKGKKGNVMEEVRLLTKSKKFDMVFACGPERMLVAIAEHCKEKEIPCQLSLERIMKCGVGICGSCDINGKSVCRDGPVFSGNEALGMLEFGKKKRDFTGTLVEI